MILLTALLAVLLRRPTARIAPARMAEEEAWSDLAAVMEEAVHGQDDVRTSLARPYVLRLYARRAAEVIARGGRVFRMSARVTAIAAGGIRIGIAAVVLGGAWALASGRIDGARLTAIWLLAIAFGATVEHIARWCRTCSTRSAPGPACSCSRTRGRSRPAGRSRPTAT